MAADPLIAAYMHRIGEPGTEVSFHCPEPQPWRCMTGSVKGPTFAVNAALEKLEAIHQAAHELREEP